MYNNSIAVGCDPELFIVNTKTNKVVSSIGLIPGKKGNAYRSKDMPEGFGLEIDNILAEFNIPPCKNVDDYVKSINYMKDYIDKYVKAKNPDLGILCTSSMYVDEDQLQSKEAKLFGCSVDYNAYTKKPNPKPKGTETNLRSAGFHWHISYYNPNIKDSLNLIKYMDMYMGLPSIIFDTDTKRRSLYGKAGCFRLCDYGVEYRTLSGYWLANNNRIKFMWEQLEKAVEAWEEGWELIDSDLIQEVINNGDVEEAKKLCIEFEILDNIDDYKEVL